MALAPKLEFRQSQQLVMTPQLQQAIKLLQLSNLELAEYVDEQLEQNPFLERTDGEGQENPREAGESAESSANEESTLQDASAVLSSDSDSEKARSELDAELDDSGSAHDGGSDYRVNEWASASSGKVVERDGEFGNSSKEISLAEHLTEQLQVETRDPHLLFIGAYLIDIIDEAGYLRETVDAIADRLGADLSEVETVLRLIQSFEPSGVGARDLKECLRLQLIERNRFDPAMERFIDNLELLAKSDLKGLMKATGADEEDVRDMIAEVRSLTPKPGYAYGGATVQIVQPDVFVRKGPDGSWKVELNADTLPRVLVNQRYYAEISRTSRDGDKLFLNEHFANANWLAKSLDQRAKTILKVANEIVRQQDGFLEYGVKHLRPLNLRVVADAISMHESTVSRVTANKYMATPRGLFEMKYFFTAAIASSEGGEAHSAEAVRHRIRELVANESADAILSDDKIVEILRSEGVDIARRTVAKYRETLHIPSSVQRRRDAQRSPI